MYVYAQVASSAWCFKMTLYIQYMSEKALLSFSSVHMQELWLFKCRQRHTLFTISGKTAGHHRAPSVFLFILFSFFIAIYVKDTHMLKHTGTVKGGQWLSEG